MEKEIEIFCANFLSKFKKEIKDELKKTFVSSEQCKGKCANGKRCSFACIPCAQYCKKHFKKNDVGVRIIQNLIYHNHLPGVFVSGCPACARQ
jgi:hypothetical protein